MGFPGRLGAPRPSDGIFDIGTDCGPHFANDLTGCRIANFDNFSFLECEL
jgi:hypothetical protein